MNIRLHSSLLFLSLLSLLLCSCHWFDGPGSGPDPKSGSALNLAADKEGFGGVLTSGPGVEDLPAALVVEDIVVGKGNLVEKGKTLNVHYKASLDDGTIIDDTHRNDKPFVFVLGEDHVIEAWNQGLDGMRVGGVRKIVAPGALAYGKRGISELVPPDATLHFLVELQSVQ